MLRVILPIFIILQTIKAEILFEAKSYDEALNVVNSILKVAPNNYPASVIKGRVLARKGEFLFAEQVIRDQLIKKNQNPNPSCPKCSYRPWGHIRFSGKNDFDLG